MPPEILVPIPEQNVDLRLYFDEMVDNESFAKALDYSVSEFDDLARLVDLEVIEVQATAADVVVCYQVSWEAFHPCDDRTIRGERVRTVKGSVDGSYWAFVKAPTSECRSTHNEF
ncbi:hypothetical protein J2X20_005822 [Pelomonas saccharophila]|uniref:SnoaL-like domain-containing protein n=1 Tax=Roseateles saccharophilus TaxID=304 RepID=A0ABU1YWA2_ROSSA|nr:hypothetical protein [Roseateles saccharophilus]MDR7273137.1 hypothetical protein [Roseateles saccharophilus]